MATPPRATVARAMHVEAGATRKAFTQMRISAKLGLTALMASLLLASAISTASARSLSVSNPNIRAVWSNLELVSPGIVTVRCRVTLEGRLHSSTIAKVERSLIGAITRADVDTEACTNGRARPRTETLPWHVTYEGFTGTLPNITAIILLLSRIRFQLIVPGLCTGDYGTSTTNITGRANLNASREITSLEAVEGRNSVGLNSGSFFCPGSGLFRNSGVVTLLGTTTRIRVTLI